MKLRNQPYAPKWEQLHTHLSSLSSAAGTMAPIVFDVPSGFSLTPTLGIIVLVGGARKFDQKERNQQEDLDVGGRIILRWILER
jgi:hypothetical protein